MTPPATVRIATRGSRLALWQAHHVGELLRRAAPAIAIEFVEVSTTGDLDRVEPLRAFGGVGVFTREVQRAVLDGRADVAVHSLKDLPTEPAEGLSLAAIPERGPRWDALVLPASRLGGGELMDLPPGARVGTGSLRRQAQLLAVRPDLRVCEVRGNVETRVRKLDEGEYDALVLAEAGLSRLGLAGRISAVLRPPVMHPAVGQGALGLECRADDRATGALLQRIDHAATRIAVLAERAMLAELRAGCHAPVGVESGISGDRIELAAVVLSADGARRVEARFAGAAGDPAATGRGAAHALLGQGAGELLTASEGDPPPPLSE